MSDRDRKSQVLILEEKQDVVGKLEPKFCGCFCGRKYT